MKVARSEWPLLAGKAAYRESPKATGANHSRRHKAKLFIRTLRIRTNSHSEEHAAERDRRPTSRALDLLAITLAEADPDGAGLSARFLRENEELTLMDG